MQSLHLLQGANSGDLSGDDILFLLNVNEIPADAQPKKVTISGLADASGPFVVAGSNTQIQYNDNGDFGASSDLTWDDSAKELGVGGDINLDDGGTYETTVQVVTPTANRTISFPDATGTVALVAGSSGQVIYNNAGALAGFNGLTINGSGNLSGGGVGTTSPAVAWDVVGQVRASAGILFGTDTAAANALDDYEEGTWTPSVADVSAGTASTPSTASFTSSGTYTKIGRQVTINGTINIGDPLTNVTVTDRFSISGLPFAAPSFFAGVGIFGGQGVSAPLGANNITFGALQSGSTLLYFSFQKLMSGYTQTYDQTLLFTFTYNI